MTNIIDFMRESAKFMASDRPDVYTPESALDELSQMMVRMREQDDDGITGFASYMLIRHIEDGLEEWDLVRKLSTAVIDYDDPEAMVYSHTKNSGVLTTNINLPDVLDPF